MISHDTRMACVRQMMIELRADGPIGIRRLKVALRDQVVGIDKVNVDEAFDLAWALMNHKTHPMVEEYEMFGERPPIEERTYVVASRMYDSQGNYKGSE